MPEGIVLTRIPLREHDEIISIITRDSGRVELVARGIKKITSKLSSHLEPFSHILFDSVQGKEMTVLTVSSLLDPFSSIRSDLAKSLQTGFAIHALYRLTQPRNLEHGVFDMVLSWLRVINATASVADARFIDWFMLQLMNSMGISPHYTSCVQCGSSQNLGFWSFFQGGVVCERCVRSNRLEGDQVFRLSYTALDDLARLDQAFAHELSSLHEFHPAVHSLILGHLQYHSEVKIGNWSHTYATSGGLV